MGQTTRNVTAIRRGFDDKDFLRRPGESFDLTLDDCAKWPAWVENIPDPDPVDREGEHEQGGVYSYWRWLAARRRSQWPIHTRWGPLDAESEVMRLALEMPADTRPCTLQFVSATGSRYIYTPIKDQYWCRWALGVDDVSGIWSVHGCAAFKAYAAHVHTDAVFTGTWTTVARDWALNRTFRFTSGATITRKIDFNALINEYGELYVFILKQITGASANVTINGSTALVNELPLVGADRRLDFYSTDVAFGPMYLVKIASGLTPGVIYAVTITCNNTTGAGGGKDVLFSGWGVPSGIGDDRSTSPENSEVVESIISNGAGVWENAIHMHPSWGGAGDWTGLNHGNEADVVTEWLDVNGNPLIVDTNTKRRSSPEITLRQTAHTRHPFSGTINLADVYYEHVFHDGGFDCFNRHTWLQPVIVDAAYLAMFTGEDPITTGQVAGDHGASYPLTLNNGAMWGKKQTRAAVMWGPPNPWAIWLYMPDLEGVDCWRKSTNYLWIQDRMGSNFSKIYYERVGSPNTQLVVPEDVWQNIAWYRISYLPSIASVLPIP